MKFIYVRYVMKGLLILLMTLWVAFLTSGGDYLLFGDQISASVREKRTRFAGHWYFAQNEIISDVYKTGMWLSRERLHRNYFKQLAENSQWVYEDLEGLIKDRARWHNRIKKIRSITTITMTITRMRLIQKAQKILLDITNYIQKESEQRRFTFTSVCQC